MGVATLSTEKKGESRGGWQPLRRCAPLRRANAAAAPLVHNPEAGDRKEGVCTQR